MEQVTTQYRPGGAPCADGDELGEVLVAGAHGGAGVSTLAFWMQPARDIGAVRRRGPGFPSLCRAVLPVVLVTRNTVMGAGRARDVINGITREGGRTSVLAVVSDSLPEPAEATRWFEALATRVDAVVRVPFVAPLRAAAHPGLVLPPEKVRDAIAEIRAAAFAVDCPGSRSTRVRGGHR